MKNPEAILVGSDHAGYALKEIIKACLTEMGLAVEDCGAHGEDSVDYSDIGIQLAQKVAAGAGRRGILICGTGIGMSMAANRVKNARAALCNDLFSAALSRKHNDANILVMGGRVIGTELAKEIVRVWMETPFEGGRHQRRIDKLDRM